ncbi:MAG: mechanosensitive ion channel family protein [Paludibacteraceae bacterium]|nr:mechanosensitive ion channel family protein [Paludibacteraceae bacterium]
MLSEIYYGNSLQDWIISLSIIIGAFLLNKLIVLINKNVIRKVTNRTKYKLDDILFKMLEAPVLLGVALLAIWIAVSRLEFDPKIINFINKAYQFMTVINVTWFVVRFVGSLIEEYLVPIAEDPNHKSLDNTLIPIIKRTILGVIWGIGVIMALRNVGVDVGAMIAGLGIGGLAFALAAQDTIKNIFGGITIFSDRPFRLGDRIVVDGFDGFVEDIGIRSTRLRTLDKQLITIPNYKIVEASILNISEEPMRKVVMKLGLTYGTTPEQMQKAIQILESLPEKIQEIDSEVLVGFTEFADFSLNITFIFWIKKEAHIFYTPSLVNMQILKEFNQNGLDFAFPTQTIYLEKDEVVK